jgi:hypothetical protein
MNKAVVTISIRAYAKSLSVDEKAVRKAIADKLIVKGVKYEIKMIKGKKVKVPTIIADVADKEWGYKHKTPKPQAGVSRKKAIEKLDKKGDGSQDAPPPVIPGRRIIDDETVDALLQQLVIYSDMEAQDAMRIREIIGAAMDKKKLEELNGSLVRKDKVEKALYKIGSELKTALHNMGIQIVRDIMSAPNEVEGMNIYRDNLNRVLNEHASLKVNVN